MALENRGNNYGVNAENINGSVHIIYNNIEAKKKLHSLMPKFIEILAQKVLKDSPANCDSIPSSYEIEDKIKHNNLKKYRYLVNEYGSYYSICESAFKALDNITIYSKERILRSVSEKYKEEKRALLSLTIEREVSDIELIREHADEIIDRIKDRIRNDIMLNCNEESIYQEDMDYCLPVFLCYAFVECKILERP